MFYSVIIPAHNAGDFILRSVGSVASQTFTDREIIVVCDACEDDTARLAMDAGATVVEVQARSPGGARNAGLDTARGDYVVFLDADDYLLHPHVLAMLAPQLRAGALDALHCGFIFGALGYAAVRGNAGLMFPNVWCRVWRRGFIGVERFSAARFAEDADFTMRLLSRPGIRAGAWETPIIYYTYPREGSLTWEHERGTNIDA